MTSTTTSYVTVAGGNATCNAFTQTLTLTTKKTKTRSQPANTNTVGGVSSVTITTQYPSCDHITRTVQNTVTEYGATAPSQVTITATRRIRAVTITMTAAAQTITATTTATTEAVGPVQYSTVPTTEYATLTSYASGSPPATIYLTRTRTTTVTASTSNAPPSTVVSVRRVVRTNTQTVMETTTSVTTGKHIAGTLYRLLSDLISSCANDPIAGSDIFRYGNTRHPDRCHHSERGYYHCT